MKKFRFLSAILVLGVLFTTTAFADFPDMPGDPLAQKAINHAVASGILSGYDDGTVRPDAYITRAEMASIISRACGAEKEGDIYDFYDIDPSAWYFPYLARAYYMGAFHGDENFNMYPDNNITFQETFTVLSQVFDLLPPYTRVSERPDPMPENTVYSEKPLPRLYDISALTARADTAGTAEWAKVYVAGLIANGACEGINIAPTEYITRSEFAIVMFNIIKNYIDYPGTYDSFPDGNTMIRCNGVSLEGLSTAYDLYIADGVNPNGIGLKDVNAKRLIVRGCANPTDSHGKLVNDSFGLTISGTYGDIRIIRPFIIADLTYAKYDRIYTAEKTSVNLGTIIEE